jgi:5-methylcytosine-specific restriction endonuclease McrA
MRESLRQLVRERCGFRCSYCGTTELDVSSELTVDHIQPRSLGGTDDLDNLLYCCHACNEFKSNY